MKNALLFACIMLLLFFVGFCVIPQIIKFILRLYERNSLFDFTILLLVVFSIWLIGED